MPALFIGHGSPMNVVLKNDPLKFTYEGFQNGSISMRCFQIG